MNRRRAPKPSKSDLRKERKLAVLPEVNEILRTRLARVPSERRLSSRILYGLLRVLVEAAYWTAVLLIWLGYGLRFVVMLPAYLLKLILLPPMYCLTMIIAALTCLQVWLIIAKVNLIFRDDEPTRQATLAAIEQAIDVELESDD
ncbi:MAG: hypothetical protein SGJ19_09755 [Planctomycetia bacterium]|nr:hypothetical protein [Planctomycetia bacterium]